MGTCVQQGESIAGRYLVERAIGHGGMGTVWLCRDEVLGRQVAVKQVGLLPGESAPDLARALREARSSAALNHPSVVSVFDAIEGDDHRLWLVMEYVPGRTLSELVKQEGRLEPRRVAAIGAQVAEGLAAAHARGTVHRDVKPGNILLYGDSAEAGDGGGDDGGAGDVGRGGDGGGDRAKIGDFGIARTEGDDQLTRSGLLVGTPLYFSPEMARGEEASAAADVWALGAALYAAVEGRPPVEDRGNPIATLTAIAEAAPTRPEHAGPLTPVLARMLDPDPASRPTMAEAARALRAVGQDDATRVWAGPAAGAAAATAPLTAASAEPEPEPLPPPAPVAAGAAAGAGATYGGRRRGLAAALAVLLLLLGAAVVALVLLPGEDEEEPVAGEATSSTADPSPEDSSTPDPEPSSSAPPPSPESPTEDAEETEDSPGAEEAAGGSGDAGQLVTDYYALLPDDTESAWQLLGGGARSDAGGYGGYTGFWDTIESVSVEGVSVDDDVVTVDLVYNGSESETRQLVVGEQGQGLVIADDLGPV